MFVCVSEGVVTIKMALIVSEFNWYINYNLLKLWRFWLTR